MQAPISLYLELEEGRRVSLESAARIALAWDGLIREIFATIDPSAEVRIELFNAPESSLGFNTLIHAVGKVAGQHPFLMGAISGVLATFFLNPIDHFADHFWANVYQAVGHNDGKFSAEQESQIKEQVVIALRENVAREQKREIFVQAYREPAITGIGAAPQWNVKPSIILPRPVIADRAGLQTVVTEKREDTVLTERIKVTLLTPKLEPRELMWRFSSPIYGPFSAKMTDAEFIKALEEHRTGVDLAIGIEMDIDLETRQVTRDGITEPTERFVRRVHSPLLGPSFVAPQLPYNQ